MYECMHIAVCMLIHTYIHIYLEYPDVCHLIYIYACMDTDIHAYIYIHMYICSMHTEYNFWQYAFQSNNTEVVIDVEKKQTNIGTK